MLPSSCTDFRSTAPFNPFFPSLDRLLRQHLLMQQKQIPRTTTPTATQAKKGKIEKKNELKNDAYDESSSVIENGVWKNASRIYWSAVCKRRSDFVLSLFFSPLFCTSFLLLVLVRVVLRDGFGFCFNLRDMCIVSWDYLLEILWVRYYVTCTSVHWHSTKLQQRKVLWLMLFDWDWFTDVPVIWRSKLFRGWLLLWKMVR